MNKLTPDEQHLLIQYDEYLTLFKARALKKFRAGIIEHRGEEIKDLEREIEQELMDITAYNFFKTIK